MTKASKARLDELNKRRVDGERVGQALLECDPATRESVCDAILRNLTTTIDAHETNDGGTEVVKRSFEDCLRAMGRQKIKVQPTWQQASDAVIAADKRAADAQRLSAAKARQASQDRRDYEEWQAEKRAKTRGTDGTTKTNDEPGDVE